MPMKLTVDDVQFTPGEIRDALGKLGVNEGLLTPDLLGQIRQRLDQLIRLDFPSYQPASSCKSNDTKETAVQLMTPPNMQMEEERHTVGADDNECHRSTKSAWFRDNPVDQVIFCRHPSPRASSRPLSAHCSSSDTFQRRRRSTSSGGRRQWSIKRDPVNLYAEYQRVWQLNALSGNSRSSRRRPASSCQSRRSPSPNLRVTVDQLLSEVGSPVHDDDDCSSPLSSSQEMDQLATRHNDDDV